MKTMTLLLLLFLIACRPAHTEENKVQKKFPDPLIIRIGESSADFGKRFPHLVNINQQPAGINFYDLDVDYLEQKVTVHFEHGKHSLDIPFSIGTTGLEDGRYLSEGISKITVFAGLSAEVKNSNEYVRTHINSLLQQFRAKGWQPRFYYDAPRLRGQEQFDYALAESEDSFVLDGAMDLSPHNWQRINWIASPYWMFYADNVLAEINFRRSPTWEDPKQPGTGLLTIDFQSMESFLRGEIEEKDRPNWRAFWPDKAKWYRDRRDSAEIRLHKAGKHIDLHYQDPPLPPPPPGQRNPELPPEVTRPAHPLLKPADQVPPRRDSPSIGTRCRSGDTCPQSGIWQVQWPGDSMLAGRPNMYGQQHIKQGQVFPRMNVPRARRYRLWQTLRGPVFSEEVVEWQLVSYTPAPKPFVPPWPRAS